MTEAWAYIDGMKVSVPLTYNDAHKCGWHKGADMKRWFPGATVDAEIARENELIEWCCETFKRNTFTVFHDSIWFYRESDAVLCQLRWS